MQQQDPRKSLYKRTKRFIDKMQAHPEVLDDVQLDWVNKIAETASEFDFDGYSNRQIEVIADIYKSFKTNSSAKNKSPNVIKAIEFVEEKCEMNGEVIRGVF